MPNTRLGMMLLMGQGQIALAAASVAVAEGELELLGFLLESEARSPVDVFIINDRDPMQDLFELSIEEALKNPIRRTYNGHYRELEYPKSGRKSQILRTG